MLQVGAFQAKNTFGSLLDRVEAGEEILITRHGKPAARLAPAHTVSDADRARAHCLGCGSRARTPPWSG